jgi:hypothetical protein
MAFTFIQQKNKQKYLVLIFVAVVCAILVVVWQGFLGGEKPVSPSLTEALAPPKIEISWQVLKDPRLEKLQAFEEIKPFEEITPEGEIGRENPFTPY